MARTVKVDLLLEASRYQKGAREAGRATDQLSDSIDDAAAAGRRAEGATEALGGELSELARDARRLDGQIDETSRGIRELAREIARTADAAERAQLSKKLNVERRRERQLTSVRDLIDFDSAAEVGAELAGQVSVSFVGRLGPLLARAPMAGMNPAVLAIGAPLAAGLATLVGTAVGGAIIGGVGIGGVAGGIMLAAKDPRVKAAGTALGTDLGEVLGRSSVAFVPVTLDAIDTIRDRVRTLEPAFNRAFSSASRYVEPLLDGLLDAAENAMPGFIDAIDAAGPVIDSIADGVRDLGSALGDGLSDLAPYADEGARALNVLFFVMEGGVRAAFNLVEAFSLLYKGAEIIGALMTGNVEKFWMLAQAEIEASGATSGLTGVVGPLEQAMRGAATETKSAEDAAKDLKTAWDDLFDGHMSYDRAVIAYKQGVKDLNAELKDGKRSLNENTAAGRENRTEVLDQIGRIGDLRQARIDQGESIDTVNGKYKSEIGTIRAKLKELGYEKGEIDALIGKYETIPARVSTKVTAETVQAEKNLADVRSLIAQIKSKRVVITTQHNTVITRSEGRNVGIGNGVGGRRWGGITEHAQWGVLREAQIASPQGPARYAWAEPATGGEAFVPRFGDPRRSLDILERAAGWYGATLQSPGQPAPMSARGAVGGGGGVPEVHVYVGTREITDIVDVRISQKNTELRRRVSAGAGTNR